MTFRIAIRAAAAGAGAATSFYGLSTFANRNSDHRASSVCSGDHVHYKGKTYKVLGHTGHHKDVFEKPMNERNLYYGNEKTAKRYAKINGGEEGEVRIVICEKMPGQKDYGMQDFEGPHVPLSPQGQDNIGAKVVRKEHVKIIRKDVTHVHIHTNQTDIDIHTSSQHTDVTKSASAMRRYISSVRGY